MDTASIQKRNEMKKYVKDTFNTEKIETVDFTVLKEKCDGGSLLPKAKYKAEFHKALTGKRAVVQIEKHEKFILQHAKASNIDDDLKNDKFGFVCLHYSVSESIGSGPEQGPEHLTIPVTHAACVQRWLSRLRQHGLWDLRADLRRR